MILHIDMDAFFASVEQAINPRLKNKPLIVGSRNSKMHTVVCAASYEAKALGIGSGMSSQEAFKLCPALEFVAADQSKYIWTSEQIFSMLKEYGFETVYASIDEFQLDIGNHCNPGGLAENIQKKIQETFHISASIGIAKNWLLAKLASKLNKPKGMVIITESNLTEILNKTPARKLCGVGQNTNQILEKFRITTCMDLYRESAQSLEKNLGKFGLNLYVSLHSVDHFNSPEKDTKPKSIGHSYTLPQASQTTRFIQAWLRLLAEMVAERLRQNNLVSGTVNLWLNGPEIGNFSSQRTFTQTTNDGYELYLKCLKIMAKIGLKTPKIRALGVTCSNLNPANYLPLFKEEKRREELIKTLDKINSRYGEGSIYPATVTLTRKLQ